MTNISDEVISVEEAKAALRCMRLCNLDEYEALESVDCLVERIRKVTMAKLVEEIIETKLTENQRTIVQEFWFLGKNTAQIARDLCVSQANVYRTLTRANACIKELLTPLVMYFSDLHSVQVAPLLLGEIMEICSAKRSQNDTLAEMLKNIRLTKAVTPEQASRAMCITVTELKKIEKGEKKPTLGFLLRFSEVFKVEFDLTFTKGKERYEWKEVLHK